MQSSLTCLQLEELKKFIAGDMSPKRVDEIEDHLSTCEVCRGSLEATVGDRDWWQELGSALRIDTADCDYESTESKESVCKRLTALLGPTDDPSMLGRIGAYEIIGLLGYGGMGAVFKGFDRSLNRFVAIKMLLPHLAASGAARKRFAREGQAVAAVVDDHVMAIHCVDEWQGVPYLVMTYSRGVSLQKRLSDNGPLEVREILRIGMQAAKGLAAAHAQGIVHRDIKPANIFLDQSVERVQLMDFGLARAVDDASLTRSGTLAGTPQYMSPEQARAETVDHRSDLFSLGSVMYAMCTGHAPFRAESSYSVLRLITDKEPRPIREINPDIPEWLCAIIGILMAKQALDRFESAKQVADLLEACLAHVQQPTTVPLPSSVAELPSLGSSTSGGNQAQTVPNGDLKKKTWRRFIGPRIGKYLAAALAAAAMILAGVVIVLELDKGTLTIKSVADDVPIRIVQGKDTVQELTVSKQGTTTRLQAGIYTVEIEGDSTEYKIQGDNVTVKRGEDTLVNISIEHRTAGATPPNSPIETAQPPVDVSNATAASKVDNVEKLLANLDLLNNREERGINTYRSTRYGRVLMELTNAGAAAVPKIIERLGQTEDDRMIASLAFVLRTIGDKRGVPALIRTIPRILLPSQGNWIQSPNVIDHQLVEFFRKHRFPGQGDAIGCSNSQTELRMAITYLTDVKFPISQTFGSGTERQVFLQRRLLYKDAKRWADWWEQESSRFVEDVTYSKVGLSPFTMTEPEAVDPDQLLDKLSWQTQSQLPFLQSATVASKGGYPEAFLDLDTGRSQSIPQRWRDKQLSDQDRVELLTWAEKEGFDLFCDELKAENGSGHYVLRGLGLKAWQIDDKWWIGGGFESNSWSNMAKEGRVVTGDQLIPYSKEKDALDPAAMGLFLFVTSERTPGWVYVGAEVTEEQDPSDIHPANWLQDKIGFVKGRKLGLQFFRANESLETHGSPTINPNAPGNVPKSANFEEYWEEIERTQSVSDDSLTAAIERFNKGMHWTYPNDDQPPLTKDELIAYASWKLERDGELPATYKVGLAKIAKQHQLPDQWNIEGKYIDIHVRPDLQPVRAYHIVLNTGDLKEKFEIRKRFLSPPTLYSTARPVKDQIGSTSLASAIKRFNAGNSQASGQEQPPLTENEVVAAIVHTQRERDFHDVSDSLFERFQHIARTRQLPEGTTLEVIPTFGVEGGSTYTIWSIRLTMLQNEPDIFGGTYGFLIREQFVSVKHGDAGSIHWGKPAENGLQAGVRLFPPLNSYQLGQKISVQILFRNILTQQMPASVPNLPSYEVEACDKEGTKLEVAVPQLQIVGGWRSETIGDQPLSLRGWPIVLLPSTTSIEERAKMRSQDDDQVVIFVDHGKSCRVRLTVSNYANDANGTLTTGEVDFAVDALDSKGVTFNSDEETVTGSDDPLSLAIDRFNERMLSKFLFHDQPPLTKDELVACATWYMERDNGISKARKDGVAKIAKQNLLPYKWTIEGEYSDLPPELGPVVVFQIYFQTDSPNERFMIRRRFLWPSKDQSPSSATTDQVDGTSLAIAVKQFNARHSHVGGQQQPRLTMNEVVAAILHNQTMRDKYAAIGVSDELLNRFQNIARTRQLPDGATLELIPTPAVKGGSTFTIWSIGIAMLGDKGHEGRTTTFEIRRQFVSVKHGDKESKVTNSTQLKGKTERVINGWPVPDTLEMPSFPTELHGNWRIQNATTLTKKKNEYFDQVAVIDKNTVLLPSGDQNTQYRLSHWKRRDDNQSIEVDLTTDSTDGKDSKTYRCLLEKHGEELILLRQQNELFPRPKSVEDISTSITRYTLTREKIEDTPEIYSSLEAIEVTKRFANIDYGKSIGVKFRVESVHPPFVPSEEDDRRHSMSELHLDFRPLPANFKDDQFLAVLTQEAIAQLSKLGISDIEKHFLHKEVEAQGLPRCCPLV